MQNAIMNQNVAQVAMDTEKVVTARDIATACGVSVGTVYTSLNDYSFGTKVSEKTKAVVKECAKRMGYNPKLAICYGYTRSAKNVRRKTAVTQQPILKSVSGNFATLQEETERMYYLRSKEARTNLEIAKLIGVSYPTVLKRIGPQPKELTEMSFALAGERKVRRNQARRNVLLKQKIAQFEQYQKEAEAINARAAELEAQAQRIADEAKAVREEYSSKIIELDTYRKEAELAAKKLGRNLA